MASESNQGSTTRSDRVHCVWVLASSPIPSVPPPVDWLPLPDRVVVADGGSSLAAQLGLTPDLVIGDLDSSDPLLVAKLQEEGVETRRYQHSTKFETDTELAVLAALDWQPSQIYLLGVTGGRLDHTLANVLLLTHPALAALDVRLVDGRQEVFLAKPGNWNAVRGAPGDIVSLLPVGGGATGVRTEGLEYPLGGEVLLQGRGRGVSNVLLIPEARVWLDGGQLFVIIGHLGRRQEDINGTC